MQRYRCKEKKKYICHSLCKSERIGKRLTTLLNQYNLILSFRRIFLSLPMNTMMKECLLSQIQN